ncbi:MAG: shikimate kinase [Butyrivibrio sp.]|nr:shikimate kinase [Butyrivibrio sp.]
MADEVYRSLSLEVAGARNIILEGFMGSGKTTVSEILSDRLGLELMDTDATIEDTEGRSISSIFREDGEEAFRDMETELLTMIAGDHLRDMVISLGGGMPVREKNRELLKESGKVVYLKASPETIYERVKGDTTRPLLQGEDPLLRIKELMDGRSDVYDEAADLIIDTDNKTPDEICDEIIRELGL